MLTLDSQQHVCSGNQNQDTRGSHTHRNSCATPARLMRDSHMHTYAMKGTSNTQQQLYSKTCTHTGKHAVTIAAITKRIGSCHNVQTQQAQTFNMRTSARKAYKTQAIATHQKNRRKTRESQQPTSQVQTSTIMSRA